MNVKSVIPTRRRLTFSVIIISLVGFFFVGYYFYFIPSNKSVEHKNAFLILENIQQNIRDRNEYLQTSFINILRKPEQDSNSKSITELQKQLDNYKLDAKIFLSSNKPYQGAGNLEKTPAGFAGDDDDSSVYLSGVNGDSLFYEASSANNRLYKIYVPSGKFIEPLLAYQKSELFSSYLLISKKAGLIYTDPELAINMGIAKDSLIASNSKAMFSGIRDININGTDFKMFYYPFRLATAQVQLCGFVNAGNYNSRLQQVPVSFIYPIVIALLLIIMLLPLVKFYIMGKDEHVRYADFVLGMISFFVGTAMLTLIIIQVLLLLAADIRARRHLENLSGQISNSFLKELTTAYVQLDKLDSLIVHQPDSLGTNNFRLHQNTDVSGIVKQFYSEIAGNTNGCYNFNRISWIDKDGDQHLKAEIANGTPVYTNVSGRDYFKLLKLNQGYSLPGYPLARIGLEPVNSFTNGGFAILVSIKSRLGNGAIAAMSLQLPSVMETIMPPGFGFCIINDEGKVLLHTDMHRNLQENFFAKADPARQIQEAIKSRQAAYFSEINLYGKTNALSIMPVTGLPYYLAAFYDKGYIVPINMRIFTFSLVFCLIAFASCLLIWLGVFRKKYARNPFLYEPMFYLNWVVPKQKKINFYILSTIFLTAYLIIQAIMIFSFNSFGISNYAVLILVLLLPVNIFAGLYVINYRIKKDEGAADTSNKNTKRNKALLALIFQPAVLLFTWFFSAGNGNPLQMGFLYFELFFFIFLCLLFFLPMGFFHTFYKLPGTYLAQYCRFATLLIICLAAFPAGIFTWYAHNQEITQAVKKEQLYLASALQKRTAYNLLFVAERKSLQPPADYFDTLQHKLGIYTIYNDIVGDASLLNSSVPQQPTYEQFYFSIANKIGNNYYDPLLIPSLTDAAADKAWYWGLDTPKKKLYFQHNGSGNDAAGNSLENNAQQGFKITSTFPERYIFAAASFRGVILIVFVVLFIGGLYRLIRFICSQLFLRRYIRYWTDNKPVDGGIETQFEAFKTAKELRGTTTGKLQVVDSTTFKNEANDFMPVSDADAMYLQDKEMIELLVRYKDFYFYLWEKCTPKEKYLLLDFALHGFVNFKNTEVIHGLLKRGIFTVPDEEVKLFSVSFRSFILTQRQSKEMMALQQEFQQEGTWQTLRIPLLLVLLALAFFIFFTQEQAFQKISALVAGVSTIFSLIVKFFSDGANVFSAKK